MSLKSAIGESPMALRLFCIFFRTNQKYLLCEAYHLKVLGTLQQLFIFGSTKISASLYFSGPIKNIWCFKHVIDMYWLACNHFLFPDQQKYACRSKQLVAKAQWRCAFFVLFLGPIKNICCLKHIN